MTKYAGMIGYATLRETEPGVWEDTFEERKAYGDILRNSLRFTAAQEINDDLTFSGRLSILSDPFSRENFHRIRYATINGIKWRVNSVEANYPRMTLFLGGPYDG